ncbi:uncharacterized protein LOC110008961 isoform X2 [Jatropha curcas]|uniref:uncharacterized protein LOC110008961 isoform X2 n=1 Tax=Jatropha curcas TaxID=180498 RepID=UPI001893A3FA|nr:uncharacterized protein LOC110008961 isoform X2 [Jatropha curcas]
MLQEWRTTTPLVAPVVHGLANVSGSCSVPAWGVMRVDGWQTFIDGAIFRNLHLVGFSAVMESAKGLFLQGLSSLLDNYNKPLLVEVLALRASLAWIIDSTTTTGCIYTNCQGGSGDKRT